MALRLGSLDLDAALEVGEGEVVALLGPNGAGKTTLLRALAGLVPLARGRVALGELTLEDAARGLRLPAERRPVGVVFQDYLLFPHLSVLDNVAFGLRARGLRRSASRATAMGWLERLGVGAAAGARPAALSGGQQQRVALARALAVDPQLLLMDEPLAALDVPLRAELRRDLRGLLRGFGGARLLITHDPVEAIALADRLVVLEGGRVVQTGTPAEITFRPRSSYVAELVGVNLLRGLAEQGRIRLDGGGELVAAEPVSGAVFALVSPRHLSLWRRRPEGSPRNVWEGVAAGLDMQGERVRVRIEGRPSLYADVTPAAVADLKLAEGGKVWVTVKATEVSVYPV